MEEPETESNDYVDQPNILQTTVSDVTTQIADTTQYQPSWEETTEDRSYGQYFFFNALKFYDLFVISLIE